MNQPHGKCAEEKEKADQEYLFHFILSMGVHFLSVEKTASTHCHATQATYYKIDNWVNGAVRSFHLVKHKRDGFSHLMLVGTENELRRAAYTTIFGFNISSSTHV